jgi:hypothetical protein
MKSDVRALMVAVHKYKWYSVKYMLVSVRKRSRG